MNNVFEYVLLDKDTVRKSFDKQTLVYPANKILMAYEYTEALEQIRLLQLHSSEVPASHATINHLKNKLQGLRTGMNLSDELCKEFKPLQYLDSNAVTIDSFAKNIMTYGSKQLFPRMLRRRLRFFFREFHAYKFYEKNYRSIPDGAELLLKSAYYLKRLIPAHFQIDCDIWSGNNEFEFELVRDYFRFLERLNKPKRTNEKQLSQEEVASILTSYFSSSEVIAMGIEIKSLNLDIVWYGPTVESLIGEAFVIGRDREEFITIFESPDAGQHVTVVTGPHFGHARNRDIFTVEIVDEDSLRVVINDWFKSGSD